MYQKARGMLRKAKTKNNGCCKTILERWFWDERYRMNLLELGRIEAQIGQHDALASEDHSYEATLEERGRCKKAWRISLNKDGIQGPIRQRPDFREAQRTSPQQYKEQSFLQIKQDIMVNFLKVSRNTTTQLILELDGDFTLQPDQQVRLHPRTGSSTAIGSRIKVGILDGLQPGLNSEIFKSRSPLAKFAQGNLLLR